MARACHTPTSAISAHRIYARLTEAGTMLPAAADVVPATNPMKTRVPVLSAQVRAVYRPWYIHLYFANGPHKQTAEENEKNTRIMTVQNFAKWSLNHCSIADSPWIHHIGLLFASWFAVRAHESCFSDSVRRRGLLSLAVGVASS